MFNIYFGKIKLEKLELKTIKFNRKLIKLDVGIYT